MRILSRVSDILESVLTWTTNVLFVWIILTIFFSVFLRYLFHIGADWVFFIAKMAAITIVFLIVGVIFKHDGHIRLTLVTGRFSPRNQQLITVVSDLVVLVFCCAFIYWSAKWALYTFAIGRESSELLGVPVGIFHLPLPIGGVIWALYTIERLIKDIVSWRVRPVEVIDTAA